jgi:hypothetical protein
MGLLSRFGRGLTEAAPIFGQMAQSSLLQAAEDKKYNRLLEREELAHKRLTDREDLAYKRATEQAATLASAKLGAQTREEKINYYKEGVSRLSGILETMIKEETDYKAQMGDLKAAMAFPGGKDALLDAYNRLKKDQAAVRQEMDRYDAIWKALIDPKGELPDFYQREESTITPAAIRISATLAAEEILGTYGVDVTGRSTLLSNDALMDEEIKDLNAVLSEREAPSLTKDQEKLFKDTVNMAVRQAEKEGENEGWEGPDVTQIDTPSVDVDIVQPREGMRAATPEDIQVITSSYGALDPEVVSIFGRWLGKAGAWTVEQFKKIPVDAILEFLSRADRATLEGMGIDPDATPIGFGESAMRTDTAPSEDNLLSMIDRFTEAQRVA